MISEQLEVQSENAYKDVKLWLKNGTRAVPSWMNDNHAFITALGGIKSTDQYIKLIKKFGRHFIVNQEQCGTILAEAKVPIGKITEIQKVITKFWSKTSTSEFFKKENWENFLQLESPLMLAIDHPILYNLDARNSENEN